MYEEDTIQHAFSYLLSPLTFSEVWPLGCPLPIYTQRSLFSFQATYANPRISVCFATVARSTPLGLRV